MSNWDVLVTPPFDAFVGDHVWYRDSLGPSIVVGVAPTVTNLTPAPGSNIVSTTALAFDVLDELDSFRRIIVAVNMPSEKVYEIIHDGDSFGPKYQNNANQRTTVTDGYRYIVERDGGWPASPNLVVFAIDTTGEENT